MSLYSVLIAAPTTHRSAQCSRPAQIAEPLEPVKAAESCEFRAGACSSIEHLTAFLSELIFEERDRRSDSARRANPWRMGLPV